MTAQRRPASAAATRTLRDRLTGMLTTATVVLAVVLLVATFAAVRLLSVQRAVTQRYFDQITRADSAYAGLADARSAVLSYATSADPSVLGPVEAVRGAAGGGFGALGADLSGSGDAAAVDAGRRAAAAAQAWTSGWVDPVVAQVRAQGAGSVSAPQLQAGQHLFDAVRTEAGNLSAALRAERDGGLRRLAQYTQVLLASVALLAVSAVVAGVLLWRALRGWVLRPIDQLTADTRAVTSGDLLHEVTLDGPGEFEVLARDVEAMRHALVVQVQQIQASRAGLEEAHARLTEQTEELRRSNRDLEQFAYVASHDLQEPLRKVASFTQLLAKRYGGQLDERADQYIQFAVDGAKRMQQLIQDLLGFSRVGRLGGETSDVPLQDALDVALDTLSERVQESDAVVTHDELPVVRGERPLLEQLLQNLVGNAIKFRHPDRAPRVHVSARPAEDGFWELECRDNGIGIEPQYAERVFVIFQRLHAKDVYEGTGIGLALCKKIVEYHGGRIWIEGTADAGTSIRWTLPGLEVERPPGPEGAEAVQPFPLPAPDPLTPDPLTT